MAAAYDLVKAGHEVTIFEGAGYPGGLAGGFKEPGWQSSVENFYHHWFQTDSDILGLMDELGLRHKVFFPRPKTVMYYKGKFYPLDSPIAALKFPGYSFPDMVRFGLVSVYLRYLAAWQPLEKFTAHEWMRRWYGENLYDLQWEPMLSGKFGPLLQGCQHGLVVGAPQSPHAPAWAPTRGVSRPLRMSLPRSLASWVSRSSSTPASRASIRPSTA